MCIVIGQRVCFSIQARLYNAASRMLTKAIEIETGMFEKPRAEVLGRLHFLQGEIGQEVQCSTDAI